MNQEKLPRNIRSIIDAIDNELKERSLIFYTDTNEYIQSIEAVMRYYYPTLYKRVMKKEVDDAHEILYKEHMDDFIDKLTTGIYNCIDNEDLYEELIEVIAKDIIRTYWLLTIEFCKENQISDIMLLPIPSASEKTKALLKQVDNIYFFEKVIDKLPLFETSVCILDDNSFMDEVIRNIEFIHLPKCIKSDVNKLLFKLESFPSFITQKKIVIDKDSLFMEDESSVTIGYKQGLDGIIYNIAYALLKDKMIAKIEESREHEDKLREIYAEKMSHRYIADECTVFESYSFSLREMINWKEMFMSYVIIYIINDGKLQDIDIDTYRYVKRILTNQITVD